MTKLGMLLKIKARYYKYINERPKPKRYLLGSWFKELYERGSNREFRNLFHLNKSSFNYLYHYVLIKNVFDRQRVNVYKLSIRSILAGSILILTTASSIEDISRKVGVSTRSLMRYSDVFINFLIYIKDEIVKIPPPEEQKFLTFTKNNSNYELTGAVFAIDGTLIKKKANHQEGIASMDRKGNNSINVMILFDKDCHIVNFYANKPGSTHDSAVFKDSYLYRHLNLGIIKENCFILGDSGYPLLSKLMVPYKSYHLNGPERPIRKWYNFCQSSARMVAERGIGLLKGRMKPLFYELRSIDSVYCVHFITACIVLHEWLLKIEGIERSSETSMDEVQRQSEYIWDYTDGESNTATRTRETLSISLWNLKRNNGL